MRNRPTLLLVLALSLVVAACGGGGDEAATTTTTTTTIPTTTTTLPPPPLSALTGEESTDEVVARPVVAIKYDNVDGRSTPQVGITVADVVYEVQVEGNITRLLALFQSEDAAPVGPVRSARGSEVGLLEELNSPLFTWHGANEVLRRAVRSSSIHPRSINDIPGLFYREASRRSPYNSFVVGTQQIRDTAPDEAAGPTVPILAFAEDLDVAPSPSSLPATTVTITFPAFGGRQPASGAAVRYDWDGEQWLRFQNGRPHVDSDGVQIAADNVIVRFTRAVDSGTRDASGTAVPTAIVTGTGEAWIFSRGTVTVGTWNKDDNTSRTRYLDDAGQEILLSPGKTWISMPYGRGSSSFL